MTATSDKRYGRGGGRYVAWNDLPSTPPPDCAVCGRPVYGHVDGDDQTHQTCAGASEVDGQTSLFGDDQ
jgi:hypothetical protein